MEIDRLLRFYSGKQVLVTGHTGFKGAWLTLWLSMAGAHVVGFAQDPPSNPALYYALSLKDRITDVRGDVRNYKTVARIVKRYNPEIIMHLAAQPILLDSYESPINTYYTNAFGTLNLLEAARRNGHVKAILNVTTDKVYMNKNQMKGYVETDSLGGHDPYSSSKACSEIITNSYRESFFAEIGTGVATARAGNVLGGGDWGAKRLVPDMVRLITKKKTIMIRYPKAIRPWNYVLDVLAGYMKLTQLVYEKPNEYAGGYNFSNPATIKRVDEVVDALIDEWGYGNYELYKSKTYEDKLLLLDSTKAQRKLGWKPKANFKRIIKNTVAWYKAYYSKMNMFEYSIEELNRYADL